MKTLKRIPDRAFTLIELLIVVAIIAILAAIAVPNFLEAQTRAKVSRAYADMRSIAVAIESYSTDWNRPPISTNEYIKVIGFNPFQNDVGDPYKYVFNCLTTPLSYMSSIPNDPFATMGVHGTAGKPKNESGKKVNERKGYFYHTLWIDGRISAENTNAAKIGYIWGLESFGPSLDGQKVISQGVSSLKHILGSVVVEERANVYDSTNGTVSKGHIVYTNKGVHNTIAEKAD